jgi:hypothetical protein
MAEKMQTLTCRAGHEWTRPSQRGKPPVWCAEHRPADPPKRDVKLTSGGSIVLTCANCNKDWERPPQRGRKPSLCPDCKPEKKAPLSFPKRRSEENEDWTSGSLIPKSKYTNQLLVSESLLKETKSDYPDCSCEDLGLKINMTWKDLINLGAGCCDSRVNAARGWVCPRLAKIRLRYY